MARFVRRENVRKRLTPFEGGQGRTTYANGVGRIELPGEAIVVRPPFGAIARFFTVPEPRQREPGAPALQHLFGRAHHRAP
jgi:hypothetical protein